MTEEKSIKIIKSIKSDIALIKEDVSSLTTSLSEVPNLVEKKLELELNNYKIKDGIDGINGQDGKDGKDGENGIDGIDGKDGTNGKDGKDGSPDRPEEIKNKLESLKGEDRLDAFAIKNLPTFVEKIAKDGYPYGLPQPAGALTYQLNGTQVGRGNILNIVGSNITTSANGDSVTYDIPASSGGTVTTDGTFIGGDGTVGDPITLLGVSTDGATVIGDGVNNPLSSISNPTGKYLVSGGISWSGSGYIYDVSALNYYFDGVFYTSTQTQVTMASADPTDNRFDAVVVDITGTVTVITGTASANPEFPTIPEDQLVVGYVLVEAGTTTPTLTTDNIYLDNAQWTTTTYTTGSGSLGSIDFNSTNAPYQGTKCAEATATNNRLGMKFTRGTAIDVQTFAFVQIWARLDAAVATNKNLNVRFDNSLGNPVGNTANLFNYGMSRTITGTWQLVVVPVSAFGSITNVKGLRAIMAGGVISNTATWSLDFMILSGGILPQSLLGPIYLSPSGTLYSEGAATGATGVTDSTIFGTLAGFQAIGANSSIFLGKMSGYEATYADDSIFIGEYAGYQAGSSTKSIFIGKQAGYQATNSVASYAFGYQASPMSFGGSIALGSAAVCTADNQLMIGSGTVPIQDVTINGTGAFTPQVGTTAERPATPVAGMIRFNTTTSKHEGYDGSTWNDFY